MIDTFNSLCTSKVFNSCILIIIQIIANNQYSLHPASFIP